MAKQFQCVLHWMSGLACLCAVGNAASAQCENSFTCSPPDASGVSYVCTSSIMCYVPSSTPSFTPDRRPGFFFGMYGGNRTCDGTPNPKAHAAFWAKEDWDDTTNGFESKLDDAFLAGFRRIMLNRPGGNAYGQYVSQAHYGHLTNGQKSILTSDLAGWIDDAESIDSEFEFSVFIGSWQSGNPCTPCQSESAGGQWWDCSDDDDDLNFTYNRRFFNPENLTSMQETYQNIKPWIDIGVKGVCFDNASRWDINENSNNLDDPYIGPRRLLDILQSPDYSSIKIFGEAIPQEKDPASSYYLDIDPDFSPYAAWFSLYQYVVGQNGTSGKGWLDGGSNPQTVDPSTTELAICFGKPTGQPNAPAYTIFNMADARDRGFLVWVSHMNAVPLIQRLYDGENNEFYNAFSDNMADFDADGDVDCDDYNTFMANWAANNSSMPDDNFSIWDGDINNDDYVNTADLLAFFGLADWTSCP